MHDALGMRCADLRSNNIFKDYISRVTRFLFEEKQNGTRFNEITKKKKR